MRTAARPAARLVLDARILGGLGRAQMAGLAGVSQSTVLRIERGDMDPTFTMLSRLLNVAGFELGTNLEPISDVSATAAARSVIDPSSGLRSFPGVDEWLDRWRRARYLDDDLEPVSLESLAYRAGRTNLLTARPGRVNYLRDRRFEQVVKSIAATGGKWAITGSMAANRLVLSASAPWWVFYVEDPKAVGEEAGLVPQGSVMGCPITLLPFDGVADVGLQSHDDGWFWADPVQVLLDCYGGNDRMPEQGDALVEFFEREGALTGA